MKIYTNFLPLLSYFFLSLLFIISACDKTPEPPIEEPPMEPDPLEAPEGTTYIEASEQHLGDAEAGRNYLLEGNFEESGIPYSLYTQASSGDGNLLGRTGDNVNINYNYTAVDAPNGVRVVAPNCFNCHAQQLDGELIIGLGNSLGDYTQDQSSIIGGLDTAMEFLYGQNSPEWEAYSPFRKATLATGPHLVAPFKGVNPASKLTAVLGAHRDPNTLEWLDEPAFEFQDDNLPSDVPAWWLLKKKNAMFLDASARGDFRKYTMASSLLTLSDHEKAAEVIGHFDDVVAYLYSLEAPEYPEEVNSDLVAQGAELFYQNCAKCHGTYGDEETFPNLLVDVQTVGTDPHYTRNNSTENHFLNWWETGWMGNEVSDAYFVFLDGYIAPPLDGVWATAPYLHNGSIPDLATLLDSSKRPIYWQRDFNNPSYNRTTVGWNYEVKDAADNTNVYDTTIEGYGNQGHYYGDGFTEEERSALIEYLKTL